MISLELQQSAAELADQLARHQSRIVFAESCTAGLVSAALGTVPGISEFHCGSWVTYREHSKRDWLCIDESIIDQHTAVSEIVTCLMARAALRLTSEAQWSAAITGYLGPQSPAGQDGLVWIAVARRTTQRSELTDGAAEPSAETRGHSTGESGGEIDIVLRQSITLAGSSRVERQQQAAVELLEAFTIQLQSCSPASE